MSQPIEEPVSGATLFSVLSEKFLLHAEVERNFSKETIVKYRDCLKQIRLILGDRYVSSYSKDDLLVLKQAMLRKNHSISRQVGILAACKGLFRYCQSEVGLAVLDPELIVPPKRPRRDVVFLSAEEVERFVAAINLVTDEGIPSLRGLRFRALVEVLLGTAMRISEVLALDRAQVDFENREAKIVGKGSKERVVFFTDRSLSWLHRYLAQRTDNHPALFACEDGKRRLQRTDLWRPFHRYRKRAGILKPVRPHLLRHTAATQLLFNGCPIGHIKEILGHERLETTCRYYLGLDRRAAKAAHRQYLNYSTGEFSQKVPADLHS
jgi:integrase/recombinase XerD